MAVLLPFPERPQFCRLEADIECKTLAVFDSGCLICRAAEGAGICPGVAESAGRAGGVDEGDARAERGAEGAV